MYLFLVLIVAILTGSGLLGSKAFLIALLITIVLCCVGIERIAESKGDDKDECH